MHRHSKGWLPQNSDAVECYFQLFSAKGAWNGMLINAMSENQDWQSGFAPILPLSCTEFRIVPKV